MTAWLLGGNRNLNCDCFKKEEVMSSLSVSQCVDLKPELRGAKMAGHGVLYPVLNFIGNVIAQ